MKESAEQTTEKKAKITSLIEWLFFALIVSLPLVKPFSLPLFSTVIPVTDFIFAITFVVWLFALASGKTHLRPSRFYLYLFLYAAAMTISTVFSDDFGRSAVKLAGEFYLLSLAILTFNVVRSLKDFRQVARGWSVGTILTIAASIAGFVLYYAGYKTTADNFALFQYGTIPAGNFPRLQAFFLNANMTCNYLTVSLLLILIAEHLGWLNKTLSRVTKAGIWLAAFFTFSPGFGGMLLAQGFWNWAKYRKTVHRRFAAGWLAIGIFAAILFFAATVIHPDTENTDQDFRLPVINYTIEPASRVLVWRQAIGTAAENPLFGKGLNAEAASVFYTTLSNEPHYLSDAHNTFLSVTVQNGTIGLAAFALLLVYLFKCFLPLGFAEDRRIIVKTGLGIAFISAFLYQGLAGSYEDTRHLWVLIGLLACFGETSEK